MSNEDTREPLGTTPPSDRNFAAFSELFPGVIREGVLDTAQLAGLLGVDVGAIKSGKEVFGLSWAGKKSSSQALQLPSYAALVPDFEKSINWDTAENVFIEGDNLEVLKLLKDTYNDKVKMIYIDPPYNTGNDFVYNDDFSDPKQRYLEITGQVDSDGNRLTANPETSGRKHSNWLNMMYPRLSLARNLLTQDGILAVSIGEDELTNLRHLLESIFGEENFVSQISLSTGANQAGDGVLIQKNLEYVLIFARDYKECEINRIDDVSESWRSVADAPTPLSTRLDMGYTVYWNSETGELRPVFDYNKDLVTTNDASQVYMDDLDLLEKGFIPIRPGTRNGKLHRWRWGIETFTERMSEVHVRTVSGKPGLYFMQNGTIPPKNLWSFSTGTTEVKNLFDGVQVFDYPKSTALLKYLVALGSHKNSLVLDFFAGSGTTGHAVELLNKEDGGARKYVCVTLNEPTPEGSEARKAGFEKVSQITEARLTKVVQISDGARSRGLRVLRLGPSNYEPYFPDDSGLFSLKSKSKSQTYSHRSASAEVLLKQGVELHQPWSGDEQIQSGSVLFLGDNVDGFELNSLAPEVMVVAANEDAFEGKDALKAKIHFDLKQINKKLVTY